jgi:hypothetical protein
MKPQSISSRFIRYIFLLLLLASGQAGFLLAQNPIELTELLAAPAISEKTYLLEQLSRGAVPTMYLNQGVETIIDPQKKTTRVITDIASINQLYNQNSHFKNIELILIQIENVSDLNWMLVVNSLNQFEILKYIYISSSVELCEPSIGGDNCEKEKIKSFISGELNPSITLVYSSEVSE